MLRITSFFLNEILLIWAVGPEYLDAKHHNKNSPLKRVLAIHSLGMNRIFLLDRFLFLTLIDQIDFLKKIELLCTMIQI